MLHNAVESYTKFSRLFERVVSSEFNVSILQIDKFHNIDVQKTKVKFWGNDAQFPYV